MNIQFTTDNLLAKDLYPPLPIKKLIPDWYKNLNLELHPGKTLDAEFRAKCPHSEPMFTAKACVPLQDYMTSGFVLRLHSDTLLSPKDCGYNYSKEHTVSYHDHIQLPLEFSGKRKNYIKFINPWTITTPPGYSCLFYQPEYFFETRFRLFPAIVDTDKHDNPVNGAGILLGDDSVLIECGTPTYCVFPFKRESWVGEVVYKERSYSKLATILHNGYRKLFHSKKDYTIK